MNARLAALLAVVAAVAQANYQLAPQPPPLAAASPQGNYQSAPPPPLAAAPPAPPPPPGFDCSDKADGYYEESKCSARFWQCSNGRATYVSCPAGLAFDSRGGACDYPSTCNSPLPRQQAPPVSSGYGGQPQPLPQPAPQRDISSFNCAGKADGLYSARPCEPVYYQCSSGNAYVKTCQTGLVFNDRSQACDYIDSCRNPVRDVPQPLPAPISNGYQQPAPARDPFCLDKVDGYYGNGCQNFFYSCNAKNAYKMSCSSGLFYDVEQRVCDQRDRIPACGGQRPPSPIPNTLPPAIAPASDVPVSVQPDFCSGKADGLYALPGCSQNFVQCNYGSARTRTCKFSLYYNGENGLCDYRERVPACGVAPSIPRDIPRPPTVLPPPPATNYIQGYSQQRQPIAAAPPVPTPAPVRCDGLADGYHAQGCSEKYISCSAGYGVQMSCPAHLRYSASTTSCDVPSNVPECGGTAPTPAAPIAQAPPRQNVDYSRNYQTPAPPTYGGQPQQPSQPSFDSSLCASKMDGLYVIGGACTPNYVMCSAQRPSISHCGDGLVFSIVAGLCDYKMNVEGCPEYRRPIPTPAPVIAAAPPQPVVSSGYGGARVQQPQQPSLDAASICRGRPDGNYGNGCSKDYVMCSGYSQYKLSCPVNLVFSQESGTCDYPANVRACGGSPPSQPPPPPPPAPIAQAPASSFQRPY